MQLSYVPILGYSFDSTKVQTDLTARFVRILEQLGAIGTGGTGETDGRNDDPPKKSVV